MTNLDGILRKWGLELLLFVLTLTTWGAALGGFISSYTPAYVILAMLLSWLAVKSKIMAKVRSKGEPIPITELETRIRHEFMEWPEESPAMEEILRFHNKFSIGGTAERPEAHAYFAELRDKMDLTLVFANPYFDENKQKTCVTGRIEHVASIWQDEFSLRSVATKYFELIKKSQSVNSDKLDAMDKKMAQRIRDLEVKSGLRVVSEESED